MFKQSGALVFYPYTQAEITSLEKLCQAERMFAIYQNNAGQLKAVGIDVNPWIAGELDDERGLKAASSTFDEGKEVSTETDFKMSLEGEFYNMIILYKPAGSLATVIAELEALST